MNRRQFIENTSLVALSTMLPSLSFPKAKFKMGYQLYSVRDAMEKDPIGTIKALSKMGYQHFELYGFDDINQKYYGIKASEFKKILDDLGLSITSGHYGFSPFLEKSEDDLKLFVDRCILGAKTLKSKYIVWPFLAPNQRTLDHFKSLSHKLNLIGEQINKSGLGFAYHNQGYDFDEINGETGYDIILKETDPKLVKLELDMFWVMHSSKKTPKMWVDEQPGRFVMWHIKDMDKMSRDYTEMGNGSINYQETLPNPAKSGLQYYYIEQGGNYAINSMKSAETSANYFKSQLQKMI